jgi:hypothetical protein
LDEHYKVTKVRPVDMFPQTHHVKNVVLLEKNNITCSFTFKYETKINTIAINHGLFLGLYA